MLMVRLMFILVTVSRPDAKNISLSIRFKYVVVVFGMDRFTSGRLLDVDFYESLADFIFLRLGLWLPISTQ